MTAKAPAATKPRNDLPTIQARITCLRFLADTLNKWYSAVPRYKKQCKVVGEIVSGIASETEKSGLKPLTFKDGKAFERFLDKTFSKEFGPNFLFLLDCHLTAGLLFSLVSYLIGDTATRFDAGLSEKSELWQAPKTKAPLLDALWEVFNGYAIAFAQGLNLGLMEDRDFKKPDVL